MEKMARNLYRVYIMDLLFRDIEDIIDSPEPMDFDTWVKENQNLFEITT